ncbi:MAG: histidinol-phosphatase HisJ family protein, partial [Oscillibacter sp.]
MYLADVHTHSRISPDASHSMTEMAAAAVAAGLDELCFTDHVEPIRWGSVQLLEDYDWSPMAQEFAAAQGVWGKEIRLRFGVELGDAPWGFALSEQFLRQAPRLDFVIGSIHALSPRFQGQDLYYFDPKDEQAARVGLGDYLEQVQKLADWGHFDVLGHLTVPLRYLNENRGFHLTLDGFEPQVDRILRTLIANGCGIELNTNRGNTPLPDAPFLRQYRALGGEIITLGSDAHSPEFVGCAMEACQALLRECGFTKFCTFTQRQPVWHPL